MLHKEIRARPLLKLDPYAATTTRLLLDATREIVSHRCELRTVVVIAGLAVFVALDDFFFDFPEIRIINDVAGLVTFPSSFSCV